MALARRDALRPEERRQKDLAIQDNLFSMEEFRKAKSILYYANFRSEVNTELMIVQTLDMGKTVLLPKVNKEESRLTKHVINGLDQISPGYMGIPEPVTESQMNVEDIDMLVVPGVGFDPSGRRIGYGGGFYDRLLPRVKGKRTIAALAFCAQVFEEVPGMPHDIPVDYIITEEKVIECNGQG